MGEKWSHDEALGTILTPGMPKAAQDSKKGGKSDLLDPPPPWVTHFGSRNCKKK